MQSPFPGMDPFLEAHWGDIHQRIVLYAADQLQSQLPADLRARVEERVLLQTADEIVRMIAPDVRIRESTSPLARDGVSVDEAGPVATLTTADPLVVQLPEAEHEAVTESFLEIRDVGSGGRVVTTIEVLSLSNKYGAEGQTQYLRKVRELRQSQVSLVEINLLRAGVRSMLVSESLIPKSHRTAYLTSVVRGWKWSAVEIYRMPLREKLPKIGVPLREHERDVILDLQALIDQCYDRGAYNDIDYRSDPQPPFGDNDAAWANQLLASWRRHDPS